jgi:hypothetical protein
MKSHGCEKPEQFPLVDIHGLRPQLEDSSYLFLGSVLALTVRLVQETVMNIWMLLND